MDKTTVLISCVLSLLTSFYIYQYILFPNEMNRLQFLVNYDLNTKNSDIQQKEVGMRRIEGGYFMMGSNSTEVYENDGESPIRKISINSFLIDESEVTNRDFKVFIESTDWKTEAEKYGWSFVFIGDVSEKQNELATQAVKGAEWWLQIFGAKWDHPAGNDSNIDEKLDHPVVHVSWHDANEYCKWRNKRLPTEAEWEYAARGGLEQKKFPWGDDRLSENREHMANTFQGKFPFENKALDGFAGTAPVKSYPPNNFGLYDMSGNVWEWTADWFTTNHNLLDTNNPKGPPDGDLKVQRGGSYLCTRDRCYRWRTSSRLGNSIDSSASNLGFRCASDL